MNRPMILANRVRVLTCADTALIASPSRASTTLIARIVNPLSSAPSVNVPDVMRRSGPPHSITAVASTVAQRATAQVDDFA